MWPRNYLYFNVARGICLAGVPSILEDMNTAIITAFLDN
jgi:hypothetical protein